MIVFVFVVISLFMKADKSEGNGLTKEKKLLMNFATFLFSHSVSIGYALTIIGLSLLVPTFLINNEIFNIQLFLIAFPFLLLGIIFIKRHPRTSLVKNRFIRLNKLYPFIILVIFGIMSIITSVYSFITVISPFLKDVRTVPDSITGKLIHGTYRGEIRFQFFMLGVIFLIFAFFIIEYVIRSYRNRKFVRVLSIENENI